MSKLLRFVTILLPLLVALPARAQFVSLVLQPGDGLVPKVSGTIDGPGLAAGLDGALGVNGARGADTSTLASTSAYAALVYRDLDRLQVGFAAASHPSLASPSSYLRAAYDEFSLSATGYLLSFGRIHADRPPSLIALLGVTLGYDQRDYFGVAPGLSVDRVANLGLNAFGLILTRPGDQLATHLNVLDTALALELAGNDVRGTAFRLTLNPVDFDNVQLSTPDAKTGRALYLDAAASAFVYKPPIFVNGGFDFDVQFGLGGSAQVHYSNTHGGIGLGVWRAANLGVIAEASSLENRAFLRYSSNFLDDKVSLHTLAFLGSAEARDGRTNHATTVSTKGLTADVGMGVLDWLDVGVRGDVGTSPYLAPDKGNPLPTTAVLGWDAAVFARLSWSKGQGVNTGVPGPH
jgi:hypothetical protein